MKAFALAAALIAAVVLAPFPASADQNPLIGTWLHTDPGTPGQTPSSAVYMTFAPNGVFEVRTVFAGGRPGQASGTSIVRGQYQMTGPTSIVYREIENYMCSSENACQPTAPMSPDFGQQKQGTFQMMGPSQMQAVGAVWNRVQ